MVDVNQAMELTMWRQWCLREELHGECGEKLSEQVTEFRSGKSRHNGRDSTILLFGLPEAGGVAVAGRDDAKPAPEAVKDKAWAASWLELAGKAGTPPESAMLAAKLQAGRLATCWTESTCWTADVQMDGAVDATLEVDGADTDRERIPSDSSTRNKASYAAEWLLRVFLVFISYARIHKDSQIEHSRSAKISKQHCMRKATRDKSPANL